MGKHVIKAADFTCHYKDRCKKAYSADCLDCSRNLDNSDIQDFFESSNRGKE